MTAARPFPSVPRHPLTTVPATRLRPVCNTASSKAVPQFQPNVWDVIRGHVGTLLDTKGGVGLPNAPVRDWLRAPYPHCPRARL